jgi:dipeptidyl aminopeptidase/acylaminoacyl peptidase
MLGFMILLISACTQPAAQATLPPPSDGIPVAAQVTTATPPPSATATPAPQVTAFPRATSTSTATLSPTQTPTSTATPRHPLDVVAMRQRTYGESDLTIEATLTWGSGYQRFIVSYLSESHRIYALMTVPLGEPPASGWPVIIFNHGYIPPDIYRSTERYKHYVEGFAQNGYIVFRSDYRGHGNSEGDAVGAYSSPAYTIDVLNGLEAVKSYPDADPQRIGMWGHSMGGYVTLRAMVVNPEIKAGVIWGGVVGSYPDLLEHWRRNRPTRTPDPESTRRSWRRDLVATYGSPKENPAFWEAISANSYVADLSGPIQLHHGTADSSVPSILSEILAEEIEAVEKPVELYLYEGDTHDIDYNFSTAISRSVAFFDRHVKGVE